ncbi:MAG: mechanosensitive ion channel family protein [Propioniciclava sp.]
MDAQPQHWWDGFLEQLPNLLIGIGLLLATWALARAVKRGAGAAANRVGLPTGGSRIVARAAATIVWTIGPVVTISVMLPGANLSAAFGALGVGSIVAGFALKEIIENFVAGMLILFTHPFTIGDQISTADHEGTVIDIQFRATILRTYDNRAVVIPNSELYTNRVTVNTRYDQVRHAIEVTFPNSYPIGPLRDAVAEILTGTDGVLSDPAPMCWDRAQRLLHRLEGPLLGGSTYDPERDLTRHQRRSCAPVRPLRRPGCDEHPPGVDRLRRLAAVWPAGGLIAAC